MSLLISLFFNSGTRQFLHESNINIVDVLQMVLAISVEFCLLGGGGVFT